MKIEVSPVQESRHFEKGDKFPVLVQHRTGTKRLFFSEFVSIITDGGDHPKLNGKYVPDTLSVYDKEFTVCTGESVTLTFNQD